MLLSSKHRWIGSDHQQHLQFMQYWVYNLYIYKEIVIDFRSSIQLLKDTKMFQKKYHRTASSMSQYHHTKIHIFINHCYGPKNEKWKYYKQQNTIK